MPRECARTPASTPPAMDCLPCPLSDDGFFVVAVVGHESGETAWLANEILRRPAFVPRALDRAGAQRVRIERHRNARAKRDVLCVLLPSDTRRAAGGDDDDTPAAAGAASPAAVEVGIVRDLGRRARARDFHARANNEGQSHPRRSAFSERRERANTNRGPSR